MSDGMKEIAGDGVSGIIALIFGQAQSSNNHAHIKFMPLEFSHPDTQL